MFIGHYAASYALKAVEPRANLGVLFLAVQLLDILSAFFVLLGIERWDIVPGITAASPLRLYIPYTHGFLTSLFWSAVVYLATRLWLRSKGAPTGALPLVLGVAVWSHWWFDLIVHRRDLPLFGTSYPVGLGLWFNAPATYLTEAALLLVGLLMYMRVTAGAGFLGRFGMPIFCVLLLIVNAGNIFGPPPPSPAMTAIAAEVSYFALAGIAYWLDKKRRVRPAGFSAT